jgi:hypothetical protein
VRRAAALALLALVAACSAPDYTPVRDWARTASLVADHPAGAVQAPPAAAQDGRAAMHEALATYLSALARMADDGVLPYLEDPFVEVAARARTADEAGGAAVAAIGQRLRLASRQNWQAPDLGYAIGAFDADVQALVGALAGPPAPAAYAALVRRVGEGHALLKARAGRLTREAVVQAIRAEEDRLRRGLLALPVPAAGP